MQPVTPVFPGSSDVETKIAEHQDEYLTLPAFRTAHSTISRWRLTDAERTHIAAGGDLFLSQVNGRAPLQPILPIADTPDNALHLALECERDLLRRLDL
jgi:hypothetical protein